MSQTRGQRAAITIGTFDGIHLGHKALLTRTHEIASQQGNLKSIAFTFDKPPQNYLGRVKELLMPSAKKLELLGKHVDHVEIVDFPTIQPLTPEEFVVQVLIGKLNASVIVIGEDFCFGKNRQGNVTTLSQLSSIHGFSVEVVPPVRVDENPVSSTAVRELLKAGDPKKAAKLLGRPHRIWGEVVRGTAQARKLGFPTANLKMDSDVLVPASGIYMSLTSIDEEVLPSALYIGNRPTTLHEDNLSIEVHVLDYPDLELYGRDLEVQILGWIREDEKFDTESQLKSAIEADIQAIRDFADKLS